MASLWQTLINRVQQAAHPTPPGTTSTGQPGVTVPMASGPNDTRPLLPLPTLSRQTFNPQPMPDVPYMPGVKVGPQSFYQYQPQWMSQLPPIPQPGQPDGPGLPHWFPQLPHFGPGQPGMPIVPPPSGPGAPPQLKPVAPLFPTLRGAPPQPVAPQAPHVPFRYTRVGQGLQLAGKQLGLQLMAQAAGPQNLGLPY